MFSVMARFACEMPVCYYWDFHCCGHRSTPVGQDWSQSPLPPGVDSVGKGSSSEKSLWEAVAAEEPRECRS